MKSLNFFKPALAITLAIVLGWLLTVRPAQAGYTVTLQQIGPDVVATGSGAIDLTGLLACCHSSGFSSGIIPGVAPPDDYGDLLVGGITTGAFSPLGDLLGVDHYWLPSGGPMSFGSGGPTSASSGSGDRVGTGEIIEVGRWLDVPGGYVSGTPLWNSATYSGKTFATLGVTPGTYVWTWGTGVDQNFTLQIGDGFPTPPPAPAPTPTPAAQIDGSGTIAAPKGHTNAQFSIFAVENEQLSNGGFSYLDKKSHIRLSTQTIQTVTINGHLGAFTGIGRLGGTRSKQMVQFTVTVRANGGAVPDTFSIVLDNGYAASGNLTSGSIRISTLDPDPD